MGILKNGPFGTTTGKIQNLVSYELNGQNVIRRIGKTNKKPTLPQLGVRQRMAVVIAFLHELKPVINIGFREQALIARKSAHNMATSYLTKNATIGDYPEISLDYSKAMLAQGDLLQPINPQVEQQGTMLRFSWDNPQYMAYSNRKDQVMMVAYFPEQKEASLEIFGALRTAGADFLEIDEELQHARMEVYIAFVASDRESASDSIHLGTLNG